MGYRIRIMHLDNLHIIMDSMIIIILGSSSCCNSSIQKLILVITLRDRRMIFLFVNLLQFRFFILFHFESHFVLLRFVTKFQNRISHMLIDLLIQTSKLNSDHEPVRKSVGQHACQSCPPARWRHTRQTPDIRRRRESL